MQLPRGTFRTIKRGSNLPALIQELRDCRFTGYCKSLHGSHLIMFVCDKGYIRLAEFGTLKGDDALEKMLYSSHGTVDTTLHDLTFAQLRLAIEFNPSFEIRLKNKTKERIRRDDHLGTISLAGTTHREIIHKNNNSMDRGAPFNIPNNNESFVHPSEKSPNNDNTQKLTGADLLEQELDAIDSIDIEGMTAKFRTSCMQIMEQLDLEHLTDQNPQD